MTCSRTKSISTLPWSTGINNQNRLCSGGGLFESETNKNGYSEELAREAFIQLIKAIQYLHSLGVCHRDIMVENLLYLSKDSNTLKLKNLGTSKLLRDKDSIRNHQKAGSVT